MLPSKIIPTYSPALLITGLPLLPPMMSAVRDKVERRILVERLLRLKPALWQRERRLGAVHVGMLVCAADRCPRRNIFSVFGVSFHLAEREAESKRGVGYVLVPSIANRALAILA